MPSRSNNARTNQKSRRCAASPSALASTNAPKEFTFPFDHCYSWPLPTQVAETGPRDLKWDLMVRRAHFSNEISQNWARSAHIIEISKIQPKCVKFIEISLRSHWDLKVRPWGELTCKLCGVVWCAAHYMSKQWSKQAWLSTLLLCRNRRTPHMHHHACLLHFDL